eukprot:gene12631-3337_t
MKRMNLGRAVGPDDIAAKENIKRRAGVRRGESRSRKGTRDLAGVDWKTGV